jgi:plastocyanin
MSACAGSSSNPEAKAAAKAGSTASLPGGASPTQIISDAVPQGATRLHFETGPLSISPGQNNIAATGSIPQPNQDGYIVGISTNLRLADGSIPPVDVIHLHHGVWQNVAAPDTTRTGNHAVKFFAAGEEKTRMYLPAGYGYAYKTSDHWALSYMLHNQLSSRNQVWITYDIDLIPATLPAAGSIKPAVPIWMDVQGGAYPVFDVVQGTGHNGNYTYPDDANSPYPGAPKNQWTSNFDGTLVETSGHMHPGGLHDDLWLKRSGVTGMTGHTKGGAPDTAHLFSSVSTYYEPAGAVSWDVAMSATPDNWRVAVHKGDVLSINTTYDSKTGSWYESMGIMVVWLAPNDTTGNDPFTTPVDAHGVLTHGHLHENDNHGGAPDPKNFQNVMNLPSRVVPSGSTLAIADFAYEGDMSTASTVPTIRQGGSLAFRNDDASMGIPHTITACTAPCDGSTGIAFPLANGQPQFDSGELATYGPPSNGKVTWQTPTNLAPGTYTYFCRIHPFMRGAFRVVPT